jgi:hypothetical protein
MRLKVKVQGARELARETEKFRKKLGLSAGKFANHAAKAVRDTVIRNVQPFGIGNKALKKGEGAVRKDLRNIFRVMPESARGSRGVISSVSEARKFHQSRRGSRGRTRKGREAMILGSIYRMYQDEVLKLVGAAKGSVMGGDPTELKGRFSPWVKRWKSAGSSRRKKSIFGAIWTFKAEPAHIASDRVMGERGIKRVMRSKDRVLRNVLRRKVKAELKKAERKINR